MSDDGNSRNDVQELLNSAEAESIDELIRNRRAQLDELRARNRAMMESLVAASPSTKPPAELETALRSHPASDVADVERTYLKAFMDHASATRRRLDALDAKTSQLRSSVVRQQACLLGLWLLLFVVVVAANGAALQANMVALIPKFVVAKATEAEL